MNNSISGKPSKLNQCLKMAFNISFWLVIPYFVFAMSFVARKLDPLYKGISPLQFGLIGMLTFVSAYPLFVWKRDTRSYPYLGALSFTKWLLLSLIVGIITIVLAIVLGLIV